MSNGFIYVVDAHFIDKIEIKYPGPKCLCTNAIKKYHTVRIVPKSKKKNRRNGD
jgi:hypothetical protein